MRDRHLQHPPQSRSAFGAAAGLCLSVSLLGLLPSAALALTSEELREEVLTSLKLPFGMSMIGGVEGAEVLVSKDAPFEVTMQGGRIGKVALPTLTYSVTEVSDDTWRISGAEFDGPIVFDIAGTPLKISGNKWDGTWSRSRQDYIDGHFVIGGFGLRMGSATEFDFGGLEIISEPYDAVTKQQRGEMVLKPIHFLQDGNAEGSDLPADMSQTMDMSAITYRYSTDLDAPLGSFAPFQAIADALVFNKQIGEDAELRRAWLLDVIDAMIVEYRSFEGVAKGGELVQTLRSPTLNADMKQESQTITFEGVNEDGMISVNSTATAQAMHYTMTSDTEPMLNGALLIERALSGVAVERMDMALLEAALVRLVETGYDNPMAVDFKAFEDVIAALGSFVMTGSVEGVDLSSGAMGPLGKLGALRYGLSLGTAQDELTRSGLSLAIEDFQTPLVAAMTGLPEGIVPSDLSLELSMDYPALALFATSIGMDRVVQISLSSDDGDEAMELLFPEMLSVYRQKPGGINLDLAVKSPDYDIKLSGSLQVEVLSEDDPSFAIFPARATAHIEVTGFDGLMTRMQQLIGETENPEIQGGVSGGLMMLGMARGMARPDGDKLIYDIVLDANGSTINEIPLPM